MIHLFFSQRCRGLSITGNRHGRRVVINLWLHAWACISTRNHSKYTELTSATLHLPTAHFGFGDVFSQHVSYFFLQTTSSDARVLADVVRLTKTAAAYLPKMLPGNQNMCFHRLLTAMQQRRTCTHIHAFRCRRVRVSHGRLV